MKRRYIHLMNGKVAYYWNNQYIAYADKSEKLSDLLVSSLYMIKKQQQKTKNYKNEIGLPFDDNEYSYMIVRI